jgi:hypothetical protein
MKKRRRNHARVWTFLRLTIFFVASFSSGGDSLESLVFTFGAESALSDAQAALYRDAADERKAALFH